MGRGLAFISYREEAGLKSALEYDGDDYGGQRLKVKIAEQKGSTPSGTTSAPTAKPEGCNSVVLRRLAPEATEADIKKAFKRCGKGPTKVGLLVDKWTGRSRCTARIDFDANDPDGVDQAIALHGSDMKGRPLVMDYCQPR